MLNISGATFSPHPKTPHEGAAGDGCTQLLLTWSEPSAAPAAATAPSLPEASRGKTSKPRLNPRPRGRPSYRSRVVGAVEDIVADRLRTGWIRVEVTLDEVHEWIRRPGKYFARGASRRVADKYFAEARAEVAIKLGVTWIRPGRTWKAWRPPPPWRRRQRATSSSAEPRLMIRRPGQDPKPGPTAPWRYRRGARPATIRQRIQTARRNRGTGSIVTYKGTIGRRSLRFDTQPITPAPLRGASDRAVAVGRERETCPKDHASGKPNAAARAAGAKLHKELTKFGVTWSWAAKIDLGHVINNAGTAAALRGRTAKELAGSVSRAVDETNARLVDGFVEFPARYVVEVLREKILGRESQSFAEARTKLAGEKNASEPEATTDADPVPTSAITVEGSPIITTPSTAGLDLLRAARASLGSAAPETLAAAQPKLSPRVNWDSRRRIEALLRDLVKPEASAAVEPPGADAAGPPSGLTSLRAAVLQASPVERAASPASRPQPGRLGLEVRRLLATARTVS